MDIHKESESDYLLQCTHYLPEQSVAAFNGLIQNYTTVTSLTAPEIFLVQTQCQREIRDWRIYTTQDATLQTGGGGVCVCVCVCEHMNLVSFFVWFFFVWGFFFLD